MNQIKNLELHDESLLEAKLYSFDLNSYLGIKILNYEFPNDLPESKNDWYRLRFEYRNRSEHYLCEETAFDARSFQECLQNLESLCKVTELPRELLAAAYKKIGLKLRYKKGYLKRKVWMPFFRDRQGLFVEGEIRNMKFSFKTNRVGLKKFADSIQAIVSQYPERKTRPNR